jgi:L-threonylcarbamoyladenylate synthase
VLPKKNTVPASACGGKDTIAIRCPRHPVASQLLASFGGPISAPSANLSGYVSPTTAAHVEQEFNGAQVVIDGGPSEKGIESTVLSLVNEPTILRPGTITAEEIKRVIGHVSQQEQTAQSDSPGTMAQHYSPHTNVVLLTTEQMDVVDDERCVAIHLEGRPATAMRRIQMPSSPEQYGAVLYNALRDADQDDASCIVIEEPPKTKAWLAIQDRLKRCSANT